MAGIVATVLIYDDATPPSVQDLLWKSRNLLPEIPMETDTDTLLKLCRGPHNDLRLDLAAAKIRAIGTNELIKKLNLTECREHDWLIAERKLRQNDIKT